MSNQMLLFLDWFFTIFHLAITLFNVSGWIFRKTRFINLIFLLLTAFSWFVLGMRYGYGYCPLTDWHWKVLRELQVQGLPNSYIKFMIDRIFGSDVNAVMVDNMVLLVFFAAFSASIILNVKDYQMKKANTAPPTSDTE